MISRREITGEGGEPTNGGAEGGDRGDDGGYGKGAGETGGYVKQDSCERCEDGSVKNKLGRVRKEKDSAEVDGQLVEER